MSSGFVDVILWSSAAYTACGVAFAVAFLGFGVGRIDPAARGAGVATRALLFPGAAVLWPVLLLKWLRAGRDRRTP